MTSTPFVSQENLRRGIQVFQSQHGWPRDFHNGFYRQLQALTSAAVTAETWDELIGYLAGWRALRPYSKRYIYLAGLPRLDELNHNLHALDQQPNGTLKSLTWSTAEPLFLCTAKIKPVTSPVFPSKLCHFLRPNIYPVVDQAVLGIGTTSYAVYWQTCQTSWLACDNQEELVALLQQAIGGDIYPGYPWATKIVELCTIGMKCR